MSDGSSYTSGGICSRGDIHGTQRSSQHLGMKTLKVLMDAIQRAMLPDEILEGN